MRTVIYLLFSLFPFILHDTLLVLWRLAAFEVKWWVALNACLARLMRVVLNFSHLPKPLRVLLVLCTFNNCFFCTQATRRVKLNSVHRSSILRTSQIIYERINRLHGIAGSPGISYDGTINATTVLPLLLSLSYADPIPNKSKQKKMFSQVIGTSSSFNRSLWYSIGDAISTEGRAMYNNQQAGLTFWVTFPSSFYPFSTGYKCIIGS